MNFNNINGVWPQIKDYIDSKLGGGTSKYKHMIYVSSLDTSDFDLSFNYYSDSEYQYYTLCSTNLNNAWCLILNSKVYYGPIENNYNNSLAVYCKYGHSSQSEKNTMRASDGGILLKEGWYINYMGQIYDWKGNIVE